MTSDPLVSIIITICNGAPFLHETIHSVLSQTYTPFEVIAVDHGSTDDSKSIVLEYPQIRYHYQEHQGNGHARNTGVSLAEADYVAFIDQDDIWYPEKLSKQMNALLADPSLMFTISHFKSFLSPGSTMPSWCRPETFTTEKPDFSPSSLVMRKEAFIQNGPFAAEMSYASDIDWFFLARDNNIPMKVVPELLHLRRVHDRNQSYDATPYKKEMLTAIRQSIHRKKKSALLQQMQ